MLPDIVYEAVIGFGLMLAAVGVVAAYRRYGRARWFAWAAIIWIVYTGWLIWTVWAPARP